MLSQDLKAEQLGCGVQTSLDSSWTASHLGNKKHPFN